MKEVTGQFYKKLWSELTNQVLTLLSAKLHVHTCRRSVCARLARQNIRRPRHPLGIEQFYYLMYLT